MVNGLQGHDKGEVGEEEEEEARGCGEEDEEAAAAGSRWRRNEPRPAFPEDGGAHLAIEDPTQCVASSFQGFQCLMMIHYLLASEAVLYQVV